MWSSLSPDKSSCYYGNLRSVGTLKTPQCIKEQGQQIKVFLREEFTFDTDTQSAGVCTYLVTLGSFHTLGHSKGAIELITHIQKRSNEQQQRNISLQ